MTIRFPWGTGLKFSSLSRIYRRAKVESCIISESKNTAYRMQDDCGLTESVVKYIWNHQLLSSDGLRLDNGDSLVVYFPGIVNREAGPDFKGAKLSFGDCDPAGGDVEIHVFSSDWRAHGHHQDQRYDNVLLHAVMWNNTGRSAVLSAKGDEIAQLELYGFLERELSALVEDFRSEERPFEVLPGNCQKLVSETDPSLLGFLLDCAGDQRMEKKAERLSAGLGKSAMDDLVYQAAAEALGYKNLKAQFRELALRVPIQSARRLTAPLESANRPCAIEAYLFGVADFIPRIDPAACDDETRLYASALCGFWETVKPEADHMVIGRHRWPRSGSRPQNFPQRRIAALARFLLKAVERPISKELKARFRAFAVNEEPRKAIKEMRRWTIDLFSGRESVYWEHRYSWNGARRPRSVKLVGEDRADIILVNAFLPALLLDASFSSDVKLERKIHSFYASFPKLKPNYPSKIASKRILGLPESDQTLMNGARRQQGLLQIYYDFCSPSSTGCGSCNFTKFARAVFKKAPGKKRM